jgi:DNA-binding PadR family transcriptional regulator
MYGYEITQEVKKLTSGKIDISEGALYPILHKFEANDLLTTEKVFIGKRVRKYYTITNSGLEEVLKMSEELNDFIETLHLIFNPKIILE